ncbi:hypothetical protein ACEPPN_004015 [Leptodophora sp. 'Broadleaf-Isolate-01']
MATFHPFPRLIPELRAQIWALATEDRVVKVNGSSSSSRPGCWSPTPPPAVTRASRESRELCSYQKSFVSLSGSRYIWANFDHDVIHILSEMLWGHMGLPINDIKHLRIELLDVTDYEEEDWWNHHIKTFDDFSKLARVDLLVVKDLLYFTQYIGDGYFGSCPKSNVRIISRATGEWLDQETLGTYQDWWDTDGGTRDLDSMTRVVHDEDDEDREERIEDIKQFQMPLPRLDLNLP